MESDQKNMTWCSLRLFKRWEIRGGYLPTMRADVLEMRQVRFSYYRCQAS